MNAESLSQNYFERMNYVVDTHQSKQDYIEAINNVNLSKQEEDKIKIN